MNAIATTFLLFLAGQVVLYFAIGSEQPHPCTNCSKTADSLSEELWNWTSGVRNKALDSAFIKGVRQMTLDPVLFGKYYMQDGVWCEEVSKSMKIAADRTPISTARHVRAVLMQESLDYLRYAKGIYSKWGITDGSSIQAGGACQSYFDYERYVAETMDYAYFIACMIPCAKLWPWMGEQLMATQNDFGLYTSWVHESLDPSYKGYEQLDALLDIAYAAGLVNKTVAYDVYKNCMEAEVDFFNSAK